MYREDGTYILGSYLPDGNAFSAKGVADTNLYKFLDAIALNFVLFEDTLESVYDEMDPKTTEDLIDNWEREYGVGDSCLGIAETLEERRTNLCIIIGLDGIQTVDDFRALIQDFGYNSNIVTGTDYYSFPLAFPALLMDEKRAKFTLIVQLPEDLNENLFPFNVTKFPIPFSSGTTNLIECLIKKLVPSSVDVEFQYVL